MKRNAKTIISMILCFSLSLSALGGMQAGAVTQAEIDALEQQREELQARQEDMQELLDAMQSDRDSLLERKSALDEQSELLRQDIALLAQQITLYEGIIAEKKAEAERAEEEKDEHYAVYCQRVRSMEEHSHWSYISFILMADSLSELLSRLVDIFDIARFDENLKADYAAALEQAEEALTDYEQAQAQQKARQAEILEQEALLAEKIADSARLIAELEVDIDRYMEFYEASEAEMEKVQAEIDAKAEELRKQEEAKRAAEQAKNNYTQPSGGNVSVSSGYYAWPSYCTYVSSPFGPRVHPIYGQLKPHTGVDIAAGYGTNITAAASGTVIMAVVDYGTVGYGTYVAIYHPNGTTTLYAHMSALCVSVGQSVSKGQLIGYVGSTGASTGPHLHFEIRVNGACVDPMQYF